LKQNELASGPQQKREVHGRTIFERFSQRSFTSTNNSLAMEFIRRTRPTGADNGHFQINERNRLCVLDNDWRRMGKHAVAERLVFPARWLDAGLCFLIVREKSFIALRFSGDRHESQRFGLPCRIYQRFILR
jgi:hypothetical protein